MENEELDSRSYIIIHFEDDSSAKFAPTLNNVSPIQVLGVAGWLEFKAKYMLNQHELELVRKELEKPSIVTPETANIDPSQLK